MAYQRVPRPANAIPNCLVWKALCLSRATFYRYLRNGSLTAPIARDGTTRLWWTRADLEVAMIEIWKLKS